MIVAPSPPGQAPTGPIWSDAAALPPVASSGDDRAVSIALADTRVQSILAGHQAWLTGSGTWSSCSGSVIGRVVSFRFAAPATFTATLPRVGRPNGKFAYSQTTQKVLAKRWTVMSVSVDLSTRAVVGIASLGGSFPGEGPSVTVPLGAPTPARDMGGPDSGDCWQSHD